MDLAKQIVVYGALAIAGVIGLKMLLAAMFGVVSDDDEFPY